MTNKEFLLKEFENKILPIVGNIDGFIRMSSEDNNISMFFNPITNKVIEISFKDHNFQYHEYLFNSKTLSSCILKTKDDTRFVMVDWSADELTILSHLIEGYGIKNYIIKFLPYKPLGKYETLYNMYEMIFSDIEDCSTFEVYFSHFFHDHEDKDVFKTIAANKLLDNLL